MNGDGKKYLVMDGDLMDKGMEHRRISPKKKLYLPTPIICICRQVISTFVRVSTSAFDIPVTLSDC